MQGVEFRFVRASKNDSLGIALSAPVDTQNGFDYSRLVKLQTRTSKIINVIGKKEAWLVTTEESWSDWSDVPYVEVGTTD